MSLLGTVAVIYFLGFTLNTFTLLALALAVGIVVDDAIMVLENIFRHAEMGKDRVRAAREGTQEITFAALAATLAVVAIFIPVVFMKGVVGKFFLQFGVTLCVAVLLSYLEAITLAPARCAQILDDRARAQRRSGAASTAAFDRLARGYARVLRAGAAPARCWCCCWRRSLLVGAVGSCFERLPSEFVPSQDQSRLMVRLQTAVGSRPRGDRPAASSAPRPIVHEPAGGRARRSRSSAASAAAASTAGIMFVTLMPPDERDDASRSSWACCARS